MGSLASLAVYAYRIDSSAHAGAALGPLRGMKAHSNWAGAAVMMDAWAKTVLI